MLKKCVLAFGLVGLIACDPVDPAPPANGVPPSIAVATFKGKCLDRGFSGKRQNAAFTGDRNFAKLDPERQKAGTFFQGYAHKVLGMLGVVGTIDFAPICGITFAPNTTVTSAYPVTVDTVVRVIGGKVIGQKDNLVLLEHRGGQVGVIIGEDRQTISLLFTRFQDARRFQEIDLLDAMTSAAEALS